MKSIPQLTSFSAAVTAPSSKSLTARALLLASMTEGDTTIANALDCDDARYMLEALRKMGFAVSGTFKDGITIGSRISMTANELELSVGNAGTAMRFLTGYLNFTPGRFLLTGDKRMLERPIGDLVDSLLSIGGEVEYADPLREGFPPLRIRGKKMRGGFEVTVTGETSSQFVSALMMAGAGLPDGLTLRAASLSSRPYVELTRDILHEFGASVSETSPNVWRIHGGRLVKERYDVEGDWSSASYWLAAAAILGGPVAIDGVRRDSRQGDRRFVDILVAMGCRAEWGDRSVRLTGPAELGGGSFDCNATPDIVPTLAAIAPFANAPVEITGIGHLRVKESDRIESVAGELAKLGARVETGPDWMRVEPGLGDMPAVIDPHDDHRLAMCFAIAGLRRGGVTIENEQVVAKSYPRFWRTLDEVMAAASPN
ncbi:MAG: 3-phosphoshikimate 1-carboxyvinyltransferase [Acidobacteria bacterium]|nr:3-phosphoshikimate 1-carboxyvinyltransferase [Acidobacteriota bacterium]